MNSKISPKSSSKPAQTKYERLGSIFGEPIKSLDPSILPKKIDVIRFWMFLYDSARSSYKITSSEKDKVRKDLLSSLVPIWEAKGLNICDKRGLERKYDRLISDADYLGKDPRCKKSDSVWIEKKRKEFDMIFDIGEASSSNSSTPSTPLKRKVDDLVS